MFRPMTRSEALSYIRKWRALADVKHRAMHCLTPKRRLEQLSSLMSSVEGMGWTRALREGEDVVRRRWETLKKRRV